MTERLQPGDRAPGFTLTDQDGAEVGLEDAPDRRTILYFYPAAGTPGCTTQACDFRDNLASLQGAGLRVLGVSPDDPERLAEFAGAESLTFPLLSDPDHAVHERYAAWGPKQVNGADVVGTIRSTFVIGTDGTVEQAMYGVQATGHVRELRELLGLG